MTTTKKRQKECDTNVMMEVEEFWIKEYCVMSGTIQCYKIRTDTWQKSHRSHFLEQTVNFKITIIMIPGSYYIILYGDITRYGDNSGVFFLPCLGAVFI